jgi:type I restriction enzyme S subunit
VSDLLLQEFDRLAQAPDGVARLRELILSLAVRGKLVPQDPADEPAESLLARSIDARRALAQSGRIGREKPAVAVDDQEADFELPTGWVWCRLSELAWPQAGFAFKSTQFNETGVGLPLIRIRDVGSDGEPSTFYSGEYRPEFIVEPGEWLVSMDGEFRVRRWHGTTALLNQRVTRLVFFSDGASAEFVVAALQQRLHALQGIKAYTTVDHLSGKQISDAVIALPPTAEQVRIVARVDEMMRLCDDLEAKGRLEAEQHTRLLDTLLGTLTDSATPEELAANWQRVAEHFDLLLDRPEAVDALEQTILQLAVRGLMVTRVASDESARVLLDRIAAQRGRQPAKSPLGIAVLDLDAAPYELPSHWEWARLGDLVENMGSGWSPACDDGERTDPTRWAVLRTTAVQVMEFRAREHKAIPLKLAPRPEIEVQSGDILVTRAGPMNRVGISCWVDQTPSRLMLSDKIVRFHPVTDELSPAFVVLALNAGWTRELLEAAKTGMAASQVNVSQADLKSLWVPVCGLEEQNRILARVSELRRLCADLRQRLAASQATQSRLAEALVDQVA